jgi:hypothetical protein
VPWKLTGNVALSPDSYLAKTGTIEGDVVVGPGKGAIKRHVRLTIAPR